MTEDETQSSETLVLALDAFVRSVGVNRSVAHALFLGAGASVTSGVPSAETCIWEWKKSIFLTRNPGLEQQFSELSLPSVRLRIQRWLDEDGSYPAKGTPSEYGFYADACYPIEADRRAFFQEKVRSTKPHLGYRLIYDLAEAGLVRSVWTTNFDGLVARAAADSSIVPIEVGLDSQDRINRQISKSELLCVSLHGDYRYDRLKNTALELQRRDTQLRDALIEELRNTPLVICGYSGRDDSIMEVLSVAYEKKGAGSVYWCSYGGQGVPRHIAAFLLRARENGRQAYYVPIGGFDDLMLRLALHCLQGDSLEAARQKIETLTVQQERRRQPFEVVDSPRNAIIKSNSFELECPQEVFALDLHKWPTTRVWKSIRQVTADKDVVAVPFRKKVLALGNLSDIEVAFRDNIKGPLERRPIGPGELRYADGAVVSLMRSALVRALSRYSGLNSDQRRELWEVAGSITQTSDGSTVRVHNSVQLYFRQIDATTYLVLKPSVRIFDNDGRDLSLDVANTVKLRILGYQHNKEFNEAINKWRNVLFGNQKTLVLDFPPDSGSGLSFSVRKSPVFAKVSVPRERPAVSIPHKMRPLIRYTGFELTEPSLAFWSRGGTGTVTDVHPIRGIIENRPYDYPLTARGLSSSLRLGVVCPKAEEPFLRDYLHRSNQSLEPTSSERDYLLRYPGFHAAYGLPLEIPEPDSSGWVYCPEPSTDDPVRGSVELANKITMVIEGLRASYSPSVILVFYPSRWGKLKGFQTDFERFDLHDYVKAFCVQRGVSSQFLEQSTLSDQLQCRVWWWLSLALYVKGMRTPWVLEGLDPETAYVGLGFSIDTAAERGAHVVVGCSHIYSSRGEGLQYRLSKVENPVIRQGNPYMSLDDARRTGEIIRELFFESRAKLPSRVVLHKRTPFIKAERDGLTAGLDGVESIDLIEIQVEDAIRYVASRQTSRGEFQDDNYPVRRGTAVKLDAFTALLWVHGSTDALNRDRRYYQGKRRIPAPLVVRRHNGRTDLRKLAGEILGLSKMDWNSFDLYTRLPATLQSSNAIARIGSLLQPLGAPSYDYRLFI